MRRFLLASFLLLSSFLKFANAQSIQINVDLTDAPRNIFHSHMIFPVKPGPMTLVYPKWIPGNHRPSGPIANATGIKMEAGGQTLVWQRDPIDMYAFHVDVPAGATELKVSLDPLSWGGRRGGGGPSAAGNLRDVKWKQVVL